MAAGHQHHRSLWRRFRSTSDLPTPGPGETSRGWAELGTNSMSRPEAWQAPPMKQLFLSLSALPGRSSMHSLGAGYDPSYARGLSVGSWVPRTQGAAHYQHR